MNLNKFKNLNKREKYAVYAVSGLIALTILIKVIMPKPASNGRKS